MRVRKIMNWPLTLFTLLSIGLIGIFGIGLAEAAFMNAWGRQHIEYDDAVVAVKDNLFQEYNSRVEKAIGFADIVRSTNNLTENELLHMMNSAISQGEWDRYGFTGDREVAFDSTGTMLGILDAKEMSRAIADVEYSGIYVIELEDTQYLFYVDASGQTGTESIQKMYFAVSLEHMLADACAQSEINQYPLYILDKKHEVMTSMNTLEDFDYSKLKDTDYYRNLDGKLTEEFISNLKKNYFNEFTSLSITYNALDTEGNQHTYTSTISDQDGQEVLIEELDSDGSVISTDVTDASLMKPEKDHIMFGTLDLSSYSIVLSDRYLWYAKKYQFDTHAPMMTLMSGKPKALTGEMLQQSIYILMIYMMVMFFLGLMFIIQILFTVLSNRKLIRLAYIDPVTKHKNWNRFLLDGKKLMKKHKTRKYAMVLYDIAKFNVYNDLYGHPDGDLLLSQIAKILHRDLRKKEICARFGADHFVILMSWDTEEELDGRIISIKKELEKVFEARSVHFTVGVYKIFDYSMSINRLYTYTTIAQENAKAHSDLEIAYFSDEQRQKMIREKELENCMVEAIKKKEFHVYLQPKYYSDGSKIGGAEALVRWISPDKGFICPGDFIPLFEKNGFIIPLDNYMVDAVCALQRKWINEGRDLLTISVNISRVHLMDPNLVKDVISIVDHYGLPHSCIELELTESAFFDAKNVLIDTIQRFRKEGFEVSMDDFGSGYSSLNSLKDLCLDVIKLDGEFFKETEDIMRSTTIVTDTIKLAKHLNMRIVAEGIEKKEQVDFLNDIGCDLIQGYYFAKPMPTDQFEELLNK